MSKDDAINIMKKFDLGKSGLLQTFSLYIRMSETTYYQRNKDSILNRAK